MNDDKETTKRNRTELDQERMRKKERRDRGAWPLEKK
jgi:hypothetical protein